MPTHKTQPNSKKLAETVRLARQRLGLTQQELAAHCGCGITFVNQVEQGKVSIRLDKLLALLSALGLGLEIKYSKTVLITTLLTDSEKT